MLSPDGRRCCKTCIYGVDAMLKVTIELVPHGVEENKSTLLEFLIINMKTSKANKANYTVIVQEKKVGDVRKTYIKSYDRNKGFLPLVFLAISGIIEASQV